MHFHIESNIDEVRRKLEELRSNAARLNGQHQVSMGELFSPSFMTAHTDCISITQFFDQGGFTITSQEDLSGIPQQQFDEYVAAHTQFASWAEMQKAAVAAWAKGQLGF